MEVSASGMPAACSVRIVLRLHEDRMVGQLPLSDNGMEALRKLFVHQKL